MDCPSSRRFGEKHTLVNFFFGLIFDYSNLFLLLSGDVCTYIGSARTYVQPNRRQVCGDFNGPLLVSPRPCVHRSGTTCNQTEDCRADTARRCRCPCAACSNPTHPPVFSFSIKNVQLHVCRPKPVVSYDTPALLQPFVVHTLTFVCCRSIP